MLCRGREVFVGRFSPWADRDGRAWIPGLPLRSAWADAEGNEESAWQAEQLGAETVVISSETSVLKEASRGIRIPDRIPEMLSPIPYIIPAQLFAALLAEAKGLSPDRPRSLEKVTKTVIRRTKDKRQNCRGRACPCPASSAKPGRDKPCPYSLPFPFSFLLPRLRHNPQIGLQRLPSTGELLFRLLIANAGTMMQSSPCFQFTGVATLYLAVNCSESIRRNTHRSCGLCLQGKLASL